MNDVNNALYIIQVSVMLIWNGLLHYNNVITATASKEVKIKSNFGNS